MAARKSTRKKTARRRSGASAAFARFEEDLPGNLRDFSRRTRRALGQLEKQVETAQRDARRQGARLLREASHRLGTLEAKGEKGWRGQTNKALRDAMHLLRRIEKAIAPPRTRRKTTRKTTRKKTTRKKTAKPSASGPAPERESAPPPPGPP